MGDRVVLVGHDEELEDGPSAGPQEQHGPVPVGPSFCIHHDLIQLVPAEHSHRVRRLLPDLDLLAKSVVLHRSRALKPSAGDAVWRTYTITLLRDQSRESSRKLSIMALLDYNQFCAGQ